MKTLKSNLFSSAFHFFPQYRLDKLFLAFLLSFALFACSDGGSSNNDDDDDSTAGVECSEGFGDASRCNAREGL